MQSLAFLWFDFELARGRLQEAFAEPEPPVDAAKLNEPGGRSVLQSSAPILRSPRVECEVPPLRTKKLKRIVYVDR